MPMPYVREDNGGLVSTCMRPGFVTSIALMYNFLTSLTRGQAINHYYNNTERSFFVMKTQVGIKV